MERTVHVLDAPTIQPSKCCCGRLPAGWYVANWTAAGPPLAWARDTGCALPTQGCSALTTTAPTSEASTLFCDPGTASLQADTRFTCSHTRRSLGTCRNVSFANGCGMVVARGASQSCSNAAYQYANPNVFGWYNTPTSRCYPATYKMVATPDSGRTIYSFPSVGSEGDKDAVCFPTVCQGGKQYLQYGSQLIRCPTGQMVDLAKASPAHYMGGRIGPCPDEAATCSTFDCGGRACSPAGGFCQDQQCTCKLGWGGEGCAKSFLGLASDDTEGTEGPSPDPSSPSSPSGDGDKPGQPLAQRNVTTWLQVVQVTLLLNATSLQAVLSQAAPMATAIAAWADMAPSQVQITDARDMAGSSAATHPVPALIATDQMDGVDQLDSVTVHTVVQGSQWVGGVEGVARRLRRRLNALTRLPSLALPPRRGGASSTGGGAPLQTGRRLFATGSSVTIQVPRHLMHVSVSCTESSCAERSWSELQPAHFRHIISLMLVMLVVCDHR